VLRQTEAFEVGGYLLYGLFLLVLLAVCLLVFVMERRRARSNRLLDLADRARKRRQRLASRASPAAGQLPNHKAVLQRELNKVPTPWGWPGGGVRHENHGQHGSNGRGAADDDHVLAHWIDYLFATKKTVDQEELRLHRNAALRSMVEDRHGHASGPAEIAYQKVIPPRLRDPDLPHDQMDNFPSGQTDAIVERLARQSRGGRSRLVGQRKRSGPALRDLKKPWGW